MKFLKALVLSLVASATSLSAQTPDSGSMSRGRDLHLPQRVGPFKLGKQERYDDPRLGTMFRYVTADTQLVDVFVYPGPDFGDRCPAECATKAFTSEIDEFTSSFAMMRERGYVDSIVVAEDDTLAPDESDPWKLGRALRLHVVRKGEPMLSDFVLWYLPMYKVKVRATYPDREPERAYVRYFTDTIVAAIENESRAAERTRGITIDVTYQGTLQSHISRIAAAMRSLGYVIADSLGNANGAYLRTTARSDWTGTALEERFKTTDDSIRLVVVLQARDDSIALRIATQLAAEPSTYSDSVSAIRTSAAIEFAGSLAEPTEAKPSRPDSQPPAESGAAPSSVQAPSYAAQKQANNDW